MIEQTPRSCIVLFALILAVPTAFASSLSYNAANNQNLGAGHYGFEKYHSPFKASGSFYDSWGFSLAQDSKVSLGIKELEPGWHHFRLLDISRMSIVFDGKDLSEGTWYHRMLEGGKQYEFRVAGDVTGLLGGAYHGMLSVSGGVSTVPLPATAWLFLSALAGLLVIRRRQQPQLTAT